MAVGAQTSQRNAACYSCSSEFSWVFQMVNIISSDLRNSTASVFARDFANFQHVFVCATWTISLQPKLLHVWIQNTTQKSVFGAWRYHRKPFGAFHAIPRLFPRVRSKTWRKRGISSREPLGSRGLYLKGTRSRWEAIERFVADTENSDSTVSSGGMPISVLAVISRTWSTTFY
jgi:hypothetical protein